ncbi:MAG: hypothetical protein KIT69_14705 [Propionibacteriaceae bacterium]|nr:hypothetical protein [Propionibacteriaceae bacterium]
MSSNFRSRASPTSECTPEGMVTMIRTIPPSEAALSRRETPCLREVRFVGDLALALLTHLVHTGLAIRRSFSVPAAVAPTAALDKSLVVLATIDVGISIIFSSGLSFLGMGPQPPNSE